MSGINTIRRITDTDTARLEAAAVRFAQRHGLRADSHEELECELYSRGDSRLARLWQAAFCRALGYRPSADLTVAYGYVGTRAR